ncbi:hypothetical protein ABZ345_32955 [Lentzea sp. NPDC005914]|uniref:hypothetical protein n=1 Tax=Lentzea sp. NPDC005914 TaxID=3154572 RepID=UPI003408E3FF
MTPVLVRLRPVVQATPTADGLHLRGWSSSCTLTGGAGLWRVWQRLAPQLSAGIPASELGVPEGTAPAVRAAVELILEQLREHDMLVPMSAEWGAGGPSAEVAEWLESAAADPVDAWRRLRSVSVTISGSGPLVEAATRAADAVGLAIARGDGPVSDAIPLTNVHESVPAVLKASLGGLVVLAGCGVDVGYVLPIDEVFISLNTEVTMRIAARLGLAGEPTTVLAALIGSAAIHRLVCAVAGLPDPAVEFAETPCPLVLVARSTPLRATYHPLLTGPADPRQTLDALTDPELGLVDTPAFGALPQIPAKLALCGDALGIGTTADAARLDAALNALKSDGIDELHANGTALRRAVRPLVGTPVPDHEWTSDPTARRWWKALTERFAVPAGLELQQLAPGAYKAEIHHGRQLLAWAVEATAADAVAFAALAATGHAQAGRDGTAHLNGAAPHHRSPGEERFQHVLGGLR